MRLQVENDGRFHIAVLVALAQRLAQALQSGAIWSSAKAKRPRRSSGAVVWLMPRAQTDMRGL